MQILKIIFIVALACLVQPGLADGYHPASSANWQEVQSINIFRDYRIKTHDNADMSLDFAIIKTKTRIVDADKSVYYTGSLNVEDYDGCAFILGGIDYGYYFLPLRASDISIPRNESLILDLPLPAGVFKTPWTLVKWPTTPDRIDHRGVQLRAIELAMLYKRKVNISVNDIEFSDLSGAINGCLTVGFAPGSDVPTENLAKISTVERVTLQPD